MKRYLLSSVSSNVLQGVFGDETIAVVVPQNFEPTANDDVVSTEFETALTFNPLENDTDPNPGDTLSISGATLQTGSGSVTHTANSVTFTPGAGFSGVATIDYNISDGEGGVSSATASVTVLPRTPVLQTAASISTNGKIGVEQNFTAAAYDDADEVQHTWTVNGLVVSTSNSYTPIPSQDLRQLQVVSRARKTGGNWSVSTASTAVEITYVAPTSQNNLPNISQTVGDGTVTVNAAGTFLGGGLTYSVSGGGSIDAGTGVVTHLDQEQSIVVVVTATNSGGSAQASYNLNIAASNEAPVAVGDVVSTAYQTSIVIAPLANDSDANNDPLSITSITQPSSGAAVLSGNQVTYTPNNGFFGSDSFQYTVSDGKGGSSVGTVSVSVQAEVLPGVTYYGANTRAGKAGISVTGTSVTAVSSGNITDWQISGGKLSPSASGEGNLPIGPLVITMNDSSTVQRTIVGNKRSSTPEEMVDEFNASVASESGLLIEGSGDRSSIGRLRLPPKQFANEFILEPSNWTEDSSDPRQSQRHLTMGALTIGGDPSGNRIFRMENLTVQGFVFNFKQGPNETEGNNGIILVERPSRHVTIRQNEIWSRKTAEIVAAGDYSNNVYTSGQLRGIATKVYAGVNEHIRIEENYVHDVSRGMGMVACNEYEGVRSRLCKNVIEDVYTNFFTCGFLNGLNIFDNKCMGVYAAQADTTGAIPATSPHSAAGGSFDAGGSRSTQNVTMMGNYLDAGSLRYKLHEDAGLAAPYIAATGCKFNDAQNPDSYYNIVCAFNTVVTRGIALETEGGENIEWFHNTLIANPGQQGGYPVFNWVSLTNLRFWKNFGNAANVGEKDGFNGWPKTPETGDGYGNHLVAGANLDEIYAGDSVKGFTRLTLDEAQLAYRAKPGSYYETANIIALNNPLYQGNGVHTATYSQPVVSNGTSHQYDMLRFDGSAGKYINLQAPQYSATKQMTYLFQGRLLPAADGVSRTLFYSKSGRVVVRKTSSNAIQVTLKDPNNDTIAQFNSDFRFTSSDGMVALAISVDMENLRVIMAKNGKPQWWPQPQVKMENKTVAIFTNNSGWALAGSNGASPLPVDLAFCAVTNNFIDLDTSAGLDQIYASDGLFKDLRGDGTAITGEAESLVLYGNGTSLVSGGLHSATLQSAVTSAPWEIVADTTAPVLSSPTATKNGQTQFTASVSTDEAAGRLFWIVQPAGVAFPSSSQIIAGQDGTGAASTASGNQDVTVTGVQNISGGGLSSATAYTVHFAQQDAADPVNTSAVSSSASFTTDAASALPITSMSLVASAGLVADAIAVPAGVQAGDLILMDHVSVNNSGTSTFTLPAGYQELGTMGSDSSTRKQRVVGKIADGSESGTSISAITNSTNGRVISVVVLRANRPLVSIATGNWQFRNSTGQVPSRVVPAADQTPANLVVGFYAAIVRNSVINPRVFSGLAHTFEAHTVDAGSDHWVKGALVPSGQSPVDVTIEMTKDYGSYNILGALSINLN